MVELPSVGKRKLAVTIIVTLVLMGLAHWGLMVDKLSGEEWVASARAVTLLAAGYLGLNVAKGIWGKE